MRWSRVAVASWLLLSSIVYGDPESYYQDIYGQRSGGIYNNYNSPGGWNYGAATPSPDLASEEAEKYPTLPRPPWLRIRNAKEMQGSSGPYSPGSPPSYPGYGSSSNNNGVRNPPQIPKDVWEQYLVNHYGGELPPPSSSSWNRRPPPSPPHDKSSDNGKKLAIGLAIGMPLLSLTGLGVVIFFIRRYVRRKQPAPSIMEVQVKKAKLNPYQKHRESPALRSADPWELERTRLTINYDNKLGSGAFCNVFKGQIIGEAPVCMMSAIAAPTTLTNCYAAVKMLPSFADDIARSDFMQSLKYHPHLVSMLGWVSDRRSPLLLVEYCENGDLLHFIRDKKVEILTGYENVGGLKIRDIVSFSWQISNGLEYLNSVGCIHRDVAARNVLVDGSLVCKIGDFGLCRLTDSLLYTARGGRLPLKWMAPESLRSYEYSFKSDVWSYGILLYELFSLGEVPFAFLQNDELLTHIDAGGRPPRPQCATDEIWGIMGECWRAEALQRPSFSLISAKLIHIVEANSDNYGYVRPTQPLESIVEVEDV